MIFASINFMKSIMYIGYELELIAILVIALLIQMQIPMALPAQVQVLPIFQRIRNSHDLREPIGASLTLPPLHLTFVDCDGVLIYLQNIMIVIVIAHEHTSLFEDNNVVTSLQVAIKIRLAKDNPEISQFCLGNLHATVVSFGFFLQGNVQQRLQLVPIALVVYNVLDNEVSQAGTAGLCYLELVDKVLG